MSLYDLCRCLGLIIGRRQHLVRFSRELGPEGGPPLAGSVDFGVIAGGRLTAITGFRDFAPGGDGE
jgi:hypothetical protein